jgi:hypothetical protein
MEMPIVRFSVAAATSSEIESATHAVLEPERGLRNPFADGSDKALRNPIVAADKALKTP